MVLTQSEAKMLATLQAKAIDETPTGSGLVLPSTMTDGSKRRLADDAEVPVPEWTVLASTTQAPEALGPKTTSRNEAPTPVPTDSPEPTPTLADIEFPPGVSSLYMWGRTRVQFGSTWKGKNYSHVQTTATSDQLMWYLNHEHTGGASMKDFVAYLRALILAKMWSPEHAEQSPDCLPGSSEKRVFID